jgi:septal ring-binding cell division protein DamX
MAARVMSRTWWVVAILIMAVALAGCATTGTAATPTLTSPPAATAPSIASSTPGATSTPSPTPSDKAGSPEPAATFHSDLELEALLPDTFDGRTVSKESRTGGDMGATDANPILGTFGKHRADLAAASGTTQPTENQSALSIGVQRLRGVPASDVLAAQLKQIPDAKVSTVTLAGHDVTYVEYGAFPVWYYPTGELLYVIGFADEATATRFFARLP